MEAQNLAIPAKKLAKGKKMHKDIILGSSSPRRREIMALFDFEYTLDSADIDESDISTDLSPKEYTTTLAMRKGKKLKQRHPHCIIITADTIVYLDGKYLCKPHDKKQAFSMLKSLSGTTHIVGSAICLTVGDQVFTEYEKTEVTLRELSEEQISTYIETFSPLDKAGAYGIQDAGGILVEKINGNFHNVVGFDIKQLEKLFSKIGIDLWKHLKKKTLAF